MDAHDLALKVAAKRVGLEFDEYMSRTAGGMRHCWRCQDWHPLSEFGQDASRNDGIRPACRKSTNEAARKNPDNSARPAPESEWRPVVGFEGLYEVSTCGLVWSRSRGGRAGRSLKPHRGRGGYLSVGLLREGTQKTLLVHRILMEAFVGPCPDGLEVRHLDGNPENNSWPQNLVYGTRLENVADKFRHGTTGRGEQHPRHKLTRADVREIHARWQRGESKRSISRRFGVTPPMIRRILSGAAWQDEFPTALEAVAA